MIDKTELIENWQFCDGSHFQDDIPELNVPNGWALRYTDNTPLPEVDPPIIGQRPECVPVSIWDLGGLGSKFAQSPPNPDGYDTVFKVHKWSAPFAFDLVQTVHGLEVGKRYEVRGYFFPDFYNEDHRPPDPEAYAAACGIGVNGDVEWVWDLPFDAWGVVKRQFIAESESVEFSLSGLAKWGLVGNTWWAHGLRLYLLDEDPPTPGGPVTVSLAAAEYDLLERIAVALEGIAESFSGGGPVPPAPEEPEAWRLPVGNDDHPAWEWYTSTRHGPNSWYNSGFHTGIDINADWGGRGDADRGEPVFAIADGVVNSVGYSGGRGWLRSVVIEHEHDGAPLYVRYAHLEAVDDEFEPGQSIGKGDLIGRLGNYLGGDGGDHLHFDMCVRGFNWNDWCSQPLTDWLDPVPVLKAHIDSDLVDSMLDANDDPQPPTPPAEPTLLGFNDWAGEQGDGADWMKAHALTPGLIVAPIYLGTEARQLDYEADAQAGLRVIANLRYSWSVDLGGGGALPLPGTSRWHLFVEAAANTIIQAKGVWGFSVGNEVNNPREFPDGGDLTPEGVRDTYNAIRARVWESTVRPRMCPGALDPFNAQAGDPRYWLATIYGGITGCEFVTAHGYVRGPDPALVGSDAKFADWPLQWQYLNYPGCVTELLRYLPIRHKSLPVYVTEFNHIWKDGGEGDWGWVDDERAAEIVELAYAAAQNAGFTGLALYRWDGDEWALVNNASVKDEVLEILA